LKVHSTRNKPVLATSRFDCSFWESGVAVCIEFSNKTLM
jgi:hypothetical protein